VNRTPTRTVFELKRPAADLEMRTVDMNSYSSVRKLEVSLSNGNSNTRDGCRPFFSVECSAWFWSDMKLLYMCFIVSDTFYITHVSQYGLQLKYF